VLPPHALIRRRRPVCRRRTACGFLRFKFAQLQAGKIDRTEYTVEYAAQLTDDAVQGMSHQLNEYGALPLRAEIMRKRSIDTQTFYQVKLVFPRGDAASLLFGFDADGKITGIGIMSMAGD
jgi:hypothetical protein